VCVFWYIYSLVGGVQTNNRILWLLSSASKTWWFNHQQVFTLWQKKNVCHGSHGPYSSMIYLLTVWWFNNGDLQC
jgi:hypothetical protein